MTPRLQAYRDQTTREYQEERERRQIAFGECFCGCRRITTVPRYTNRPCGWVAGLSKRYVRGHSPVEHLIVSKEIQFTTEGFPYQLIALTQNQVAMVSPHRYEEISSLIWSASWVKNIQNYYAIRTAYIDGKKRKIYMHRQILGLEHGDSPQGDHKDRTRTLNNIDQNLRFASSEGQQQNKGKSRANTSGYKGVYLNKKTGRWIAQIRFHKKKIYLGSFDTPELAHAAYCSAAIKYHGEFARVA